MKRRITFTLCLLLLLGWVQQVRMQESNTFISALDWNPVQPLLAVSVGRDTGGVCYGDFESNKIKLLNVDGSFVKELQGHYCQVTSLAFNPDGSMLASVSMSGRWTVWDVSSGEILTAVLFPLQWKSVSWKPDGSFLSLMEVDFIDFITVSKETGLGVLINPDLATDSYFTDAVWKPDGRFIAVSSEDGSVRIWDVNTFAISQPIQLHSNAVLSLTWNPNGDTIASGDESGIIHIWDASTGEILSTLTGHVGAVRDLSWSPDGKLLSSGSDDGTMRVWEATTGEQIDNHRYTGAVLAVDWNPQGGQIAFGGVGAEGQDGEVVIVDAPRLSGLVANAGADQSHLTPGGTVVVTLDGSRSGFVSGSIQSYVWTEGEVEIGQGEQAKVLLSPGVHTLTLTVTGSDGTTARDEVVIEIIVGTPTPTRTPHPPTLTPTQTPVPPTHTRTPAPPIAHAGADQTVTASDEGTASVTLDGSGSHDPDGTFLYYEWKQNEVVISTEMSPTLNLAVGEHTFTLWVTDFTDMMGLDTVTVRVIAP